jgi:hypothetical protein
MEYLYLKLWLELFILNICVIIFGPSDELFLKVISFTYTVVAIYPVKNTLYLMAVLNIMAWFKIVKTFDYIGDHLFFYLYIIIIFGTPVIAIIVIIIYKMFKRHKRNIISIPMLTHPIIVISDPLELCVICCEEYTSSMKVMILPCNHTFHSLCISKWSITNNTCPMCRSIF